MKFLKLFTPNWHFKVEALRKKMDDLDQLPEESVDSVQAPDHRYKFILMDDITGVQLPVATDNIDKFTKTDMMKVVKAFKEGVQAEEKRLEDIRAEAEKALAEKHESNKRSDSDVAKRVRSSRKIRKS